MAVTVRASLLIYYTPLGVHICALQSEGRITLIIVTFSGYVFILTRIMTLGHNSLGLVMVLFFIIVPTLALEKVFIHLRILAPMLVAFGIRHSGWSAMYQGYLTVFCFHEKLPFSGYH
jgi:hypothetical protein